MVQAAAMAVCAGCGSQNPDGQRFCGSCAAPLQDASRREQRKTVTTVFCDLVGSTALGESRDPEAVGVVLAGYFERMRATVERHGGLVQKFIGDAVVAVFGVPITHEDDVLRALRAALKMQEALSALGVQGRIGVNTGEVVTRADDTLVIGDAVNVAARLQQAAAPGEVLIGGETRALAGAAVDVDEPRSLTLKGKSQPVAAVRLLSVGEAPERLHGGRFVGRLDELVLLRAAWERAADGESWRPFPLWASRGWGSLGWWRSFSRVSRRASCGGGASPTGRGSPIFRWSTSSDSSTWQNRSGRCCSARFASR